MADGLRTFANWSQIIPWVAIAIFSVGGILRMLSAFGALSDRLDRLRFIFESLVIEVLPWMVVVSAIRAANYLVHHKWGDAVVEGILIAFWIREWHRNDDDRWKKRRRKLLARVKQVGSRLTVEEAGSRG